METVEGNASIMECNCIIATFMQVGEKIHKGEWCERYILSHGGFLKHELLYHNSYNWLIPDWVKFRDLKFAKTVQQEVSHSRWCNNIARKIVDEPISKAFTELVSALKWYESLKK